MKTVNSQLCGTETIKPVLDNRGISLDRHYVIIYKTSPSLVLQGMLWSLTATVISKEAMRF